MDSDLHYFITTVHQAPHSLLNAISAHQLVSLPKPNDAPLLRPHLDPNPPHLSYELLIIELLSMHRPCHHRNPRADSFHYGVPPAMREECSNGTVVEDKQLWSPAPDDHTLVRIPLFKPLGQPLLFLNLALMFLPFLLGNHPYEFVTRCFYPACNLIKLLIREKAKTPKAYVHHRVDSLRVKPTQALVHAHRTLLAPLRFLLSGFA
ncbi:hypothetical protein CR513_41270, partial [Mucuna pruriens]